MSKLNVDQKTIFDLLLDKKADFLIPDYQRPYAWEEEQCQTLWDDIFSFSFPNNDYEALRKFYERNKYQYLKKTKTIGELKPLALFWQSVSCQDKERFSDNLLKKLFVLNNAPNGMWQNITSIYFLQNRSNDESSLLEETKFCEFLDKITVFIFTYAITNPGVNALRTPIYDEMINIINGTNVTFSKYKFSEAKTRSFFENYVFTNQRNITRFMLTWYAYTFQGQQLLKTDEILHLEHIYSKKRQEMDGGL